MMKMTISTLSQHTDASARKMKNISHVTSASAGRRISQSVKQVVLASNLAILAILK